MRHAWLAVTMTLATAFAAAVAASGQQSGSSSAKPQSTHNEHAHHHPAAAELKNPVPAAAESVEIGRALYARRCVRCHGETGKGDGRDAAAMKVADLTDADWKHGETDGEMFVLIRDGAKGGMPKFSRFLTEQQIWNVVNYVRTLKQP